MTTTPPKYPPRVWLDEDFYVYFENPNPEPSDVNYISAPEVEARLKERELTSKAEAYEEAARVMREGCCPMDFEIRAAALRAEAEKVK